MKLLFDRFCTIMFPLQNFSRLEECSRMIYVKDIDHIFWSCSLAKACWSVFMHAIYQISSGDSAKTIYKAPPLGKSNIEFLANLVIKRWMCILEYQSLQEIESITKARAWSWSVGNDQVSRKVKTLWNLSPTQSCISHRSTATCTKLDIKFRIK